MRRSFAIVALVLMALARPALAQESPTPSGDCAIGVVCTNPLETGPGEQQPVNDPPGNYVRSLITIGFILLLVGTYLFVALTGKSLKLRSRGNANT